MKKMHIVLIVLIAAVSAILVSTYTKAVDSVTFAEAAAKTDRQVKVVGTFDKTQSIEYDANTDAYAHEVSKQVQRPKTFIIS